MASTNGASVNWGGFALLSGAMTSVAVVLTLAESGSGPLALATGGAALLTLVFAGAAVRARRLREAKLSADLTAVSERLLRLEGRAPAGEGRAPAGPEPRIQALVSGVAADLEILTRLATQMAETLRAHDRDLRELREGARGPAPDRAETGPSPPGASTLPSPPAELTTREDFARAASAIMSKLAPAGPAAPTPPVPPPAAPAVADRSALAALDEGLVELLLEPIATLPQRHTRLYEATLSVRGRDEAVLGGDTAPERRGRLPERDLAALPRILSVAAHLGSRDPSVGVSWALAPASLADPAFQERAFAALASSPDAARRILFRISLGDLVAADAALARFRALGIGLVLDGPTDLRPGWAGSAAQGVRFVRLRADLLLDPGRRREASDALFAARAAGIGLIASGVEAESVIPDLLELNVPLAQGPALGAARPVRAEVLAGSAPPAAAAPSAEAREGESDPNRAAPFRDFLRRAG